MTSKTGHATWRPQHSKYYYSEYILQKMYYLELIIKFHNKRI